MYLFSPSGLTRFEKINKIDNDYYYILITTFKWEIIAFLTICLILNSYFMLKFMKKEYSYARIEGK